MKRRRLALVPPFSKGPSTGMRTGGRPARATSTRRASARASSSTCREQYADVPNVSFETAVLPAFDVDRRFDFAYTYATLHYVREVETAIRAIYRRVRPGGCLVCNYPNRETREEYRDVEGKLRERFRLVCGGENLTSRDRIAGLLDADVRDFWEVTDADGPYVRSSNPCVVVEK